MKAEKDGRTKKMWRSLRKKLRTYIEKWKGKKKEETDRDQTEENNESKKDLIKFYM